MLKTYKSQVTETRLVNVEYTVEAETYEDAEDAFATGECDSSIDIETVAITDRYIHSVWQDNA